MDEFTFYTDNTFINNMDLSKGDNQYSFLKYIGILPVVTIVC